MLRDRDADRCVSAPKRRRIPMNRDDAINLQPALPVLP